MFFSDCELCIRSKLCMCSRGEVPLWTVHIHQGGNNRWWQFRITRTHLSHFTCPSLTSKSISQNERGWNSQRTVPYSIIGATRCQPVCQKEKKKAKIMCRCVCLFGRQRAERKMIKGKGVAERNCPTTMIHSATIGNLIMVSILCLASKVSIILLWPAIAAWYQLFSMANSLRGLQQTAGPTSQGS